ncbi:MAG: DUF21 domain-containing protein, partial [Planctomycetes bacterium]|nr:DUF21 domain-containing protein [Planctomycetota bacterium]
MAYDWILLCLLLVSSGALSASETAYFSLGAKDSMASDLPKVSRLLQEPRELLISLLAGNLFVNVFFFATASHVIPGDRLWAGLIALVTILICGEIVPKTLALRMSHGVARFSAPLLVPYVRVMKPVIVGVNAFLNLGLRVFGESQRREPGVSVEILAGALDHSAAEGSLAHGEAELLGEIIQLSTLRVR